MAQKKHPHWLPVTSSCASPFFIVLLLVYILIYEPLGFLLSSGLVLPAGMIMLGEKRPSQILLFPALIIGLGYLGFTKVMMVPLPEFPTHLFF